VYDTPGKATPSLQSLKNKFCATERFHIILYSKDGGMRRDVFQGIADPTRRAILGMIAKESLNVNSVSSNFGISRAAIYKHMKILSECGLLVIKQKGRERFCEARVEGLHKVSDWVEQYRRTWEARLDNLEHYLDELQTKKKRHVKKK
jgi:DNA-binding transcriptional ArsR family regulator